MKFHTIALAALATLPTVGTVAFAETVTLKPNWDDPKLKEAMAQVQSVRETGLSAAFTLPDEPLPVSIPVLGMSIPDAVTTGSEKESAVYGFARTGKSQWYSQQYTSKDESVSIVIYGNAVIDAPAATLPSEDDPPDIQFMTADGDTLPSEVKATFVRFGIPYSVTISCSEPGQKACSEPKAIDELVHSLQVIGGAP